MATQAQLDDAKLQLHKLLTGNKRVVIQKDGIRTEYTEANAYQLKAYITELEAALDQTTILRRPGRVC